MTRIPGQVWLQREIEQPGDLDDVGVLPQPTVAVVRGLPSPRWDEPDRVPDRFGDGVADRELQALLGKRSDQGVGVARAVPADDDLLAAPPVRDLREGPVQDGQVIGGGVAAGVTRAQQHRDGLVAVVQPRAQGVMTEAALKVPADVLLVRMGRDQRRVEVDHDVGDGLARRAGARQLRPGRHWYIALPCTKHKVCPPLLAASSPLASGATSAFRCGGTGSGLVDRGRLR